MGRVPVTPFQAALALLHLATRFRQKLRFRAGGGLRRFALSGAPPDGGDEALGLVEFSIFPHVENPDLPTNTMAAAERWAAGLSGPAYAIDDETAIKVVDGTVEVVSEGHWKLFTRSAVATESGY